MIFRSQHITLGGPELLFANYRDGIDKMVATKSLENDQRKKVLSLRKRVYERERETKDVHKEYQNYSPTWKKRNKKVDLRLTLVMCMNSRYTARRGNLEVIFTY